MPRQKHRSQLDAIDKIDMTPLIDLTFLLLIVFIITAPLMENAVDVSPPQMNADQIPEDNSKVVTLNRNGEVVFEHKAVSMDELLATLSRIYAGNNKLSILLRADGEQKYDRVIEVMKTIKNAGFKNISLVTEVEDKK